MTKQKGNLRHSGFTLIEMAIVLVVVGIIISLVASFLPTLISSSKIRQARATLEKMDYALVGYLAANGRCPCPDTDNDGLENRIVGATPPTNDTCAAYVGQIPYATIGLASALDPWQEPVRYGVYEDLIRTQTGGLCSAAPCTLCLSDFVTNPNVAWLRTNDGATVSNQGYVLVSGGPKDLDGTGGFFDGRNGDGDTEFDAPVRIIDTTYDDMVRANSFAYLQGKLCSGSMGGGGGGGGTEGPGYGNCADGLDNDADGTTDCADADCAADPACIASALTISTASIPSGVLNSSYSTTFTATGGTTPYSWSLTNNGGFGDFNINAFTGMLTGTLDQCPGNYNINVQVDDSTPAGSGGPYTDSQGFTLQVTSNLTVGCTSATPPIAWSSSTQTETFSATGARLGNINWSLNSGGATGFTITSTGAATCSLSKTGSATPGSYTFTITGTDAVCATNTDDYSFDVLVTAAGGAAPGGIGGVVDTLIFSYWDSYTPSIIHVGGDIYGIVTRGWLGDGYAHTVDIATDGQIGARQDYYDFDGDATTPGMVNVSGDIYAVAFEGSGNRGYIKTIDIAADGQIANNTIDTMQFINSNCEFPTIIQISGDIFAVVYAGNGSDGYIATVQIAANGQITNGTIDTLQYDHTNGEMPDIIHVSGDVYAIAYRGAGDDGFLATVTIDSSGQISASPIDTLEFDAGNCTEPDIIQVGGEYYAIAYQGPGNDGYVTTVQIAGDGQITNTVIDSLEFDTSDGYEPVIATNGGGIFAVAYRGPGDDGFFSTMTIDGSGQISNSVLDTIEFETDSCFEPSMVYIGNNIFAITYRSSFWGQNQGVVTTIALQ